MPERYYTDLHTVAGVDEVGRGPLAGPVTAAAVVLHPSRPIAGLADSKRLSPARREALAEIIRRDALDCCVAHASVGEIDTLNILQASLLAMQRAVQGLRRLPEIALVDGNRPPHLPCVAVPIVGGDDRVAAISAASILAKVTRDRLMVGLAEAYPGYGFESHKGYGTAQHRRALAEMGATPWHRQSFAPVRDLHAASSAVDSQPSTTT